MCHIWNTGLLGCTLKQNQSKKLVQMLQLLNQDVFIQKVSMLYHQIMVVVKLADLKNSMLCDKLSKGCGHNLYGEPA